MIDRYYTFDEIDGDDYDEEDDDDESGSDDDIYNMIF